MDETIRKQLEQQELTPFHAKMLEHCKSLLTLSRNRMQEHYPQWDRHDDVYNGIRKADDADRKAAERGEPVKMIVPLTKAQVQTAVSFSLALYLQKSNFFELYGTGTEDFKAAKIAEALLERDLRYNVHTQKIYQYLLDVFRFGIGIIKHSWHKEMQILPQKETSPGFTVFGVTIGKKTTITNKECTKFLGNKLFNISPYRFFPDPRLPMTRFQEGEFCGSEDEISKTELLQKQHEGYYAGIKYVQDWSKDTWNVRSNSRLPNSGFIDPQVSVGKSGNKSGVAITVTELQVKIIPQDFMIEEDKPLGPENYPVKYVVVIANDNRVIKCEPLGYIHNEFTYDVAQFDPDQHHFLNGGLAESIDELQSVITWLINSHITAVRKSIQNFLVVDPEMIHMEDVHERRPVIRLRKGAAMSGIDRYIKQLEIRDVTKGNISDASMLGDLLTTVSGVNENAQGQYSKGRRSAEQTRAVNAGAATRLRVVAMLVWSMGILPLGRKMLSNLRDGLDEETFVKVLGLQTLNPTDPNQINVNDFRQSFKVSREDIVGNYDFEELDGTLPSEKANVASMLQELLMMLIQNPEAAAIFGYDPRKLLFEILQLRGVKNPQQFAIAPTLPPGGVQAAQAQAQTQVAQADAQGAQADAAASQADAQAAIQQAQIQQQMQQQQAAAGAQQQQQVPPQQQQQQQQQAASAGVGMLDLLNAA
jgi:hypothetical protein